MKLVSLITGALIAQLLAAPLASGMLVLCFGSDGHVAVESAGPNHCCSEWEAARHETPGDGLPMTIAPASESCCNDVELSVESATLTIPTPNVLPASAVPCSVSVAASHLRTDSAGAIPLVAESPVAEALRTVVLRA
jgi:hypothetical protein